ncbi:MAG: tRNA preQ1(34) S-adenosylmethionine ribosyltransferase-isomerase QueA [Candidatus Pacebacteria bacterium CG10_big_fil_rev_8_21_14_0_10_36_11]|nr:tRNA preQ1(34) S-adenosylmethionine ribosyltransferase-isomerase QueA [Candidatus Pacearchaeota archaeon]OIP74301.1 MAG: tRNA preQ1(34) S-adenosylmethionine ribosyltransferase-isomerase QueA [Candidatus Pacebacteria bacterium CG2_30_36_39]PIR64863.1 MAG: tRNA preQ1(34) S-adenosylmethionine ribosyltransferase-isomerase QueA [Candidatus Pacebacteria bacterium CG10_big_fil_rev_8_21_14_0_10_36_11]
MDVSLFDYNLSQDKIAQFPAEPRDSSKLLVINRKQETLTHEIFHDLLSQLGSNDVLVLNESKVFPARLLGKKESGSLAEILLLHPVGQEKWLAIGRPNLKSGQTVYFENNATARVLSKKYGGEIEVQLTTSTSDAELLDQIGHTPLPPYIHSNLSEQQLREKYQTVYAQQQGSAAAPTAGLHFTEELLTKLTEKGVQIEKVTLHVGLGTFQNLRPENITEKKLHSEWYEVSVEAAQRLNGAKKAGKRIIAVGTTSARTLESATLNGEIVAGANTTQLFIFPPYKFKFVDSLITNFHLPKSSLLMLVSSLVSEPQAQKAFTTFADSLVGKAYAEAITKNYRFFSFGDAMWIQ